MDHIHHTISHSSNNHTSDSNNHVQNIEINPVINSLIHPQTSTTAALPIVSTNSSLVNIIDGFTSRVTGDRHVELTNNNESINNSANGVSSGSLVSLTSIGSLGTTANAFYSSIGLAFNSLTSPITAAAAAATATTAEAAAVVVAAASAISNHLSSPTNGSPPNLDDELYDDDEDYDDEECIENENDDNSNVPAPPIRKSWNEIKIAVNEMRKQLANMSSLVPINIQFRGLSDGRIRCYFLSTPPHAWETTLLYTDINMLQHAQPLVNTTDNNTETNHVYRSFGSNTETERESGSSYNMSLDMEYTPSMPKTASQMCINICQPTATTMYKKLQWNYVLEHPISSMVASGTVGGANVWSREYQLLQERKRLSAWGITSYELHKPSGKIVFPCYNDLYQCLDTGFNTSPLFPTQLRTCPAWVPLDPQICPQNSDLIAYISGGDIWVTHTLSGHEERLTFAHDGRRTFADDPLTAGVPSYVMQEEFCRYQGYWWQPQSQDTIYRIVYEEVDESDVCLYTFPSSQAVPGEIEEYRFPRTGSHNAKSKLKMVQFSLNESLQITDVTTKDLPYTLTSLLPWLEYIVRVGWTPDCKYIWIQAMDRKQQRLDIVLIPLDNFCENYNSSTSSPSGSADHNWSSSYWKTISPLQVIHSQVCDTWINVHDLLYFMEISDSAVTFLWGSEETGYRHLYLITSSLVVLTQNGGEMLPDNHAKVSNAKNIKHSTEKSRISDGHFENLATLIPRVINKVALTTGEWEVLGRNLWVDKKQLVVYFLGLRDTPLEKHLYAVSLQRPGHVRLLTEPGYSYSVEFDENFQLMLQTFCNIQRLPSSKVLRVEQTCENGGVNGLQLTLVGYLSEGGKPEPQFCPQIFQPQLSSGDIVYAMVFKPHNYQLGVKYPAVLNVYGGPEVQTVNNTFKGKHQLRLHMLAAQGYCVICIDSRGSRHRGIKFESYLRCRMGQVELTDQVDALRILAEQLGYIDMDRVAIHGWSYGGYLSLMGLVQYPDVFKIAVAGAPVTDWENYDTGYTERYMDLPQNNKHGYSAGSVLNYIHSFPEEENRLLLIHGLIDENVHFFHTSQLIAALNKANKPYDLHIFPDERHSLRSLESNKNYETKLLSFLQNL